MIDGLDEGVVRPVGGFKTRVEAGSGLTFGNQIHHAKRHVAVQDRLSTLVNIDALRDVHTQHVQQRVPPQTVVNGNAVDRGLDFRARP